MGRRKIPIKRLESSKARQAKFSKRKQGLLKKAKELAILCEVDLALIMFSPTEKSFAFVGQDKELSSVLTRFFQLSIEERNERRIYTAKMLEKMYATSNPEVDPRSFTTNRREILRIHQHQMAELHKKLMEKDQIIMEWRNPLMVGDMTQARIMEDHLVGLLNKLKIKTGRNWTVPQWTPQNGATNIEGGNWIVPQCAPQNVATNNENGNWTGPHWAPPNVATNIEGGNWTEQQWPQQNDATNIEGVNWVGPQWTPENEATFNEVTGFEHAPQ